MTAVLSINPGVLRWARETAGLSIAQVANKLHRKSIDAETVGSWEEGTASPNYFQLEQLARTVYNRPLAVFFFPVVPDEETITTQLRTLPDAAIDKLPPEIIKLCKKAKLFQLYLGELYEGATPSEASLLTRFALDDRCELADTARRIREVLGVSFREQSEWQSVVTAVKKWREALEGSGVFVFKDAFRNGDYSGFCLYNPKYPLIYVNNSMPASRQVFTLFHELAHLLYRSGGVDFRNQEMVDSFDGYYLSVEVCCNRFASEFLVPQTEFDALPVKVSEAHFEKLAEYFSVSREVILRKYRDQDIVDARYYETMAKKWVEQAKVGRRDSTGGSYYNNVRAYLGEGYINLVFGQYYHNKISFESVAEYLNVKPKNLLNFEHMVI